MLCLWLYIMMTSHELSKFSTTYIYLLESVLLSIDLVVALIKLTDLSRWYIFLLIPGVSHVWLKPDEFQTSWFQMHALSFLLFGKQQPFQWSLLCELYWAIKIVFVSHFFTFLVLVLVIEWIRVEGDLSAPTNAAPLDSLYHNSLNIP